MSEQGFTLGSPFLRAVVIPNKWNESDENCQCPAQTAGAEIAHWRIEPGPGKNCYDV